ncbi:MAG: single-stranded DNA-binding protein [Negativicutes bacterium]|nr:single-stranded DNA-binding protein [Negativicutes bacterium]
MNSITVYGRLTDKPEVKTSQDGKSTYTHFTLADNRGEKASFFRCTAFGKVGENIAKAEKGHRLVVAGRMEEDEWTDQQTQQKRRSWTLIVNDMSYVEPAPQQQQLPGYQQQYQPPMPPQYPPQPGYPAPYPAPQGYAQQYQSPAPAPQPPLPGFVPAPQGYPQQYQPQPAPAQPPRQTPF